MAINAIMHLIHRFAQAEARVGQSETVAMPLPLRQPGHASGRIVGQRYGRHQLHVFYFLRQLETDPPRHPRSAFSGIVGGVRPLFKQTERIVRFRFRSQHPEPSDGEFSIGFWLRIQFLPKQFVEYGKRPRGRIFAAHVRFDEFFLESVNRIVEQLLPTQCVSRRFDAKCIDQKILQIAGCIDQQLGLRRGCCVFAFSISLKAHCQLVIAYTDKIQEKPIQYRQALRCVDIFVIKSAQLQFQ